MNIHLKRFIPRDDSSLWQNVFAKKIDHRFGRVALLHVEVLEMLASLMDEKRIKTLDLC